MAAQERAKQAQEKQQQEEQKKLSEKKENDISPPSFDLLSSEELPPPSIEDVPPPIEDVPPPIEAVPPPSFEALAAPPVVEAPPPVYEEELLVPMVAAPSAPPLTDDMHHNHEHTLAEVGITQIVPPPSTDAPPSFDQFQQQMDSTATTVEEEAFMLDEDGNVLTPEKRKAMIEEQRRIMEQIQKESRENAAAIAAARAESFDQRSGPAVAAAAGGSQIRPTASASSTSRANTETEEAPVHRTVEIGNGQHVALHGQDRTKKAIAEGTAILVQCINCQNWTQVTDTATLMFCPVCQVVSPVIQQTEVMTKEEAVQLTLDRKMAERLQNEEYEEQEEEDGPGFLERITGTGSSTYPATAQSSQQQRAPPATKSATWGDWFGSFIGSDETKNRTAEIAVARPPTAGSTANLGPVHSVSTGTERPTVLSSTTSADEDDEHQGLLVSNAASRNTSEQQQHLPGRVAKSKPLFSCVADSVSSVANAVSGALTSTTLTEDAEGNVHGVDASSLLAVTTVGRGGGGNYSSLPSDE